MRRKVLPLMLAAALVFNMAACGQKDAGSEENSSISVLDENDEGTTDGDNADEEIAQGPALIGSRAGEAYEEVSAEIYEEALGDFYSLYQSAEQTANMSERYARLAIAEARLLESAAILPSTSYGGTEALTRVVPHTVSSVISSNDKERYHNVLTTVTAIRERDWNALKELWAQLRGTGTYYERAKNYLLYNGYSLKDRLTYTFSENPKSWDPFAPENKGKYAPFCNTYDGLMEYDCENILQPALAESYEVSDDGLTYTFHIREGAKWVNYQGQKVADVTADDFVAGAQHALDTGNGREALVGNGGAGIVGAEKYVDGINKDFSLVGIKAVDTYTLEYMLEKECPYFMNLLSSVGFAPLNREYYRSEGGKFGGQYSLDDAENLYGSNREHILYCGPYICTACDKNFRIVLQRNSHYWDADNNNIGIIHIIYDNGSDMDKTYEDFLYRNTDFLELTDPYLVERAEQDGIYYRYIHITPISTTSYLNYFNLNRQSFANQNDAEAFASDKTQEEVDRTYEAINNVHFRRALAYSVDREAYNAELRGDKLAATNLINTITRGAYVTLDEEVEIRINKELVTFPAGTRYGEIIQAQLDADACPIQVWNPNTDNGVGSAEGFDGWYHPVDAMEELETAIKELKSKGLTISPENPIILDYPVWSGDEAYLAHAEAYKQSVEEILQNNVEIRLVTSENRDDWYYAEYYCENGQVMNYDIGDIIGWTPKYADPGAVLSTFLPNHEGYCTKILGIY